VSGDVIVPLVPSDPDCGVTPAGDNPCPSVSTPQTWGFDVTTRAWHRLCLGGLGAHGSIDQVGMASYAGGVLLLSDVDGAWRWDGSTWTQVAPGPASSFIEPSGMALVYDPATGEVVGFGGYGGSPVEIDSDATWTWDGTAWADLGGTPPPRAPFAPCTSSDLIVDGGDTWKGQEPIKYDVEINASTACQLTGTAVFTLVDATGATLSLKGNPASAAVNAELSPQGDALRITYAVTSACIPPDTTTEFTVGTLIHESFQAMGGSSSCAAAEPPGARIAVASVATFS
jgi:hypothetical protein